MVQHSLDLRLSAAPSQGVVPAHGPRCKGNGPKKGASGKEETREISNWALGV